MLGPKGWLYGKRIHKPKAEQRRQCSLHGFMQEQMADGNAIFGADSCRLAVNAKSPEGYDGI